MLMFMPCANKSICRFDFDGFITSPYQAFKTLLLSDSSTNNSLFDSFFKHILFYFLVLWLEKMKAVAEADVLFFFSWVVKKMTKRSSCVFNSSTTKNAYFKH